VFYSQNPIELLAVEASGRPIMTAVDDITGLRQQRETIVKQHIEAENGHDVEATIATFTIRVTR
jgi:hypothetical protein